MDQGGISTANSVHETFTAVAGLAADFMTARRGDPVAPPVDAARLRAELAGIDFRPPRDTAAVAAELLELLGRHAVRSDHPRYFGLFNPPALPAAILGDLIAATVNPQLAVWSHAPAATEIERRLVELFGQRIWPQEKTAGTFTSGGSEANHTALLCALTRRYPEWARHGVHGLDRRPAIHVSSESHLAWIKLARAAGLGSDAVRLVPARDGLEMTGAALADSIARSAGTDPVLVVATAGTTAHGAIDDMKGIAQVAREHGSHFHVDAAWAGGGLLHPEVRRWLDGIEQADSVTLDPHKWLAVPMAAGMYLARDWQALQRAFSVDTSYMPSASLEQRDAYIHSLQWSRRAIGLKLFMALSTIGIDGYVDIMQRQLALADRLRDGLRARQWQVLNDTRLPLVCFAPAVPGSEQDIAVRAVERALIASGQAWISSVKLRGRWVLRACITSFETNESDIDALLAALDEARDRSWQQKTGTTA